MGIKILLWCALRCVVGCCWFLDGWMDHHHRELVGLDHHRELVGMLSARSGTFSKTTTPERVLVVVV